MEGQQVDVAVVGGGLAGLAVAAYLGRAGYSVTLFEKASEVGGRAITHQYGDFYFNQGPHALYKAQARQVLTELGVKFTGKPPKQTATSLVYQGRRYSAGGAFMSRQLGSLSARLKILKLLAGMGKLKTEQYNQLSLAEWLDQQYGASPARLLIEVLARVATYVNAPAEVSAGVVLAQIRAALKGVIYLDYGWQTLVEGLRTAAIAAGVTIRTGQRVTGVEPDGQVWLDNGESLRTGRVVLAVGPEVASKLVEHGHNPTLQEWAEKATPVKAACLDLALSRLPQPKKTAAFGLDKPLYLSVHSASAKLGPSGAAVIHLLKYLDPSQESDPRQDRQELEELLDLMQPGWRELVIEQRYLPRMTVSNYLVKAGAGGLSDRPGPSVPGCPNLYVVGDWVGAEGLLVDGSLASARQVAQTIIGQGKSKAVTKLVGVEIS